MRFLAALPGKAVDTTIELAWALAYKTFQLAEWIESFEFQAEEQFTKEQLRLVPGEYR